MENLDRRLVLGAAGVAGLAALSRLAKAGPLDPPGGPVASTGHTTDELYDRIARTSGGIAEPRIPLQSLAAAPPYNINQPGSYYLTAHVPVSPTTTAIFINTSNVTLDLCGYAIAAPDGEGDLVGLHVTGNFTNIVVRAGTFANARAYLAGQGAFEDCAISGAADNSQFSFLSNGAWVYRRCLFTGVSASASTLQVGSGCGLIVETCAFRSVSTGIDVFSGGRAIVRGCQFDGAGYFGIRFLTSTTGAVMDNVFTNCATGCLNQSGSTVKFLRNVGFANTQSFSGVSNVSTDPATAPPWANLAL